MNDHELATKVHSAMYRQCRDRGYATAVDVLMELGYLKKDDYESWRHGRIAYLERVCTVNLSKLSTVRHEMRGYARKANLKPSFCYYKQWAVKKKGGQGHRPVIPLRFSKYGKDDIEKQYATHFVDSKRVAELKAQRVQVSAKSKEAQSTAADDEFDGEYDGAAESSQQT